MGDILLETQGVPVTPAASQAVIFVDNQAEALCLKDEAGKVKGGSHNASIAQQSIVTSDTWITGTDLQIPAGGMQVGMVFEWEIIVTRSGAGTATPVFQIRTGTNKSTADTSRLSITTAAQTGVADTGKIVVQATVRSVSATGVIRGNVHIQHNLAATGLANTPAGFNLVEGSSAAFDNSAMAGQFVSLSINTGANSTWVIEQVIGKVRY